MYTHRKYGIDFIRSAVKNRTNMNWTKDKLRYINICKETRISLSLNFLVCLVSTYKEKYLNIFLNKTGLVQ